jgi:hypothetical protein
MTRLFGVRKLACALCRGSLLSRSRTREARPKKQQDTGSDNEGGLSHDVSMKALKGRYRICTDTPIFSQFLHRQ